MRLIALRLPEEAIRLCLATSQARGGTPSPRALESSDVDDGPSEEQATIRASELGPRHKVSASKQRQLEWLLVLTNVESQVLSARQVVALMRLRGPIELLWKLVARRKAK